MKIFLVTLEYPPLHGGVSRYLATLYGERTDDVCVIAPPHHRLLYAWCRPRWAPLYFTLTRRVARERPDAIHISHVLPIGIIARHIKKKFGIPYTIFFHGTDLLHARRTKRKWRQVEHIVRDAERCIVNSEATAKLFRSLLPQANEPVVLVPGTESAPLVSLETKTALKEKYALTNKRVILFLGRLVERKGLVCALDALQELLRDEKNVVLVVVGDGPERKRAERRVVHENLATHVRFVGSVQDAECFVWYTIADIFWFPIQNIVDEWEGFGMVALEAQSCGCPVIASALQGAREAVHDGRGGFLVEPNAHAVVVATKKIFASDALHATLRQGAREWAAEFSIDRMRKKFEHVTHLAPLQSTHAYGIVIPIYGRVEKLVWCLTSISQQTHAPQEVIVVDDGNTPTDAQKIGALCEKFSARYVRQEENRGASAARNVGASRVQTDRIFFCDADVILEPNALMTLSAALDAHEDADFAYGDFVFGKVLMHGKPFSTHELSAHNFISTMSLVTTRAFPGFDEKLSRFQDWDVWLTIAENGGRGIYVSKKIFSTDMRGTMSTRIPSWMARHARWFIWLSRIRAYERARALIKIKHPTVDR